MAAWSPDPPDMNAWNARIRRIRPFLALVGDETAGYADVRPDGAGAWARHGIGAALMAHLEARARDAGIPELRADVSLTAEPFFRRFGFEIVERHPDHTIRGVNVPNARMRKALA